MKRYWLVVGLVVVLLISGLSAWVLWQRLQQVQQSPSSLNTTVATTPCGQLPPISVHNNFPPGELHGAMVGSVLALPFCLEALEPLGSAVQKLKLGYRTDSGYTQLVLPVYNTVDTQLSPTAHGPIKATDLGGYISPPATVSLRLTYAADNDGFDLNAAVASAAAFYQPWGLTDWHDYYAPLRLQTHTPDTIGRALEAADRQALEAVIVRTIDKVTGGL